MLSGSINKNNRLIYSPEVETTLFITTIQPSFTATHVIDPQILYRTVCECDSLSHWVQNVKKHQRAAEAELEARPG